MSRQARTKAAIRGKAAQKWRQSRWWLPLVAAMGIACWFGYSRFAGQKPPFPSAPTHSDPKVTAQIDHAFKVVQESPRSGKLWGELGMILHAYQFDEEARVCFENAQRFDSADPRWPYFEGVILLASNPEAALPRLARAVELCPSTPDTPRLRYARALFEHGHLPQAEAQSKELLLRNPSHTPALLGLARIHDARGEWLQATELLKRCLESPYVARAAYGLLASVQSKAGNTAAARAASDIAKNLPPDQSWPEPYTDAVIALQFGKEQLIAQAERAIREGRQADAEPIVVRLIEHHGALPETWLLAGRLRLDKKDCLGAEQALRKHLELQPNSVNGLARLGAALLCQENYTDALPIFERAVQLKPDFAEAHFNLGFARARAGQGRAALPALREAIRHSPNFIEPYIILADLLGQIGDVEEALALLQRAREINATDPRLPVLRDRIQTPRN